MVRCERDRSGLEGACRRVALTTRGRELGVVANGIEITSSMLRAALPGIGMLAERDVRELMVVVEVMVRPK